MYLPAKNNMWMSWASPHRSKNIYFFDPLLQEGRQSVQQQVLSQGGQVFVLEGSSLWEETATFVVENRVASVEQLIVVDF